MTTGGFQWQRMGKMRHWTRTDKQLQREREDGHGWTDCIRGCARLCQVVPVSQFRFAEKCCQEGFRFVARCRDVYEMHAYLLRSLVASARCTSTCHRSQWSRSISWWNIPMIPIATWLPTSCHWHPMTWKRQVRDEADKDMDKTWTRRDKTRKVSRPSRLDWRTFGCCEFEASGMIASRSGSINSMQDSGDGTTGWWGWLMKKQMKQMLMSFELIHIDSQPHSTHSISEITGKSQINHK